MTETTHFGYQTVPTAEKTQRVRAVFDSVAGRYDLMNDLMSGGLHRLWKRFALARTGLRPGDLALDVAGGTGDITAGLQRQVGRDGLVCLTDINASMMEVGRRRLTDRGIAGNVTYVLSDAQSLPFADASFHCVTIAFGLRNVTDKQAALDSMSRVLRPGGVCWSWSSPDRCCHCSRRSTMPIRSACCPSSAVSSPTMKRATAISPSPFACIRISRPSPP